MAVNHEKQVEIYMSLVEQFQHELSAIQEAKQNETIFWSAIKERKLRDKQRDLNVAKKKLAYHRSKLDNDKPN